MRVMLEPLQALMKAWWKSQRTWPTDCFRKLMINGAATSVPTGQILRKVPSAIMKANMVKTPTTAVISAPVNSIQPITKGDMRDTGTAMRRTSSRGAKGAIGAEENIYIVELPWPNQLIRF